VLRQRTPTQLTCLLAPLITHTDDIQGKTIAPPSDSLNTGDGMYKAGTNDGYVNWYQCVRVWYRDLT
jgi:hypothetical protein